MPNCGICKYDSNKPGAQRQENSHPGFLYTGCVATRAEGFASEIAFPDLGWKPMQTSPRLIGSSEVKARMESSGKDLSSSQG